MKRDTYVTPLRLGLIAAAFSLALSQGIHAQNGPGRIGQGNGSSNGQGIGQGNNKNCVVNGKSFDNCSPSQLRHAKREETRQKAPPQKVRVTKNFAGVSAATALKSPLASVRLVPTVKPKANGASGERLAAASMDPLAAGAELPRMAAGQVPDYFGAGNYANSAFPEICTGPGVPAGCTVAGPIVPLTGLRKFVDTLPGLCPGTNDLGQCIPLATPDTLTFPGSDFYRIGLTEYQKRMHADLPDGTLATKLRGYVQLNSSNVPVGVNQYLGPLILATRNRPVRVLFKNMLLNDLPLPIDTTYMGAGAVSALGNSQMASKKRATLHLHGGNPPWISDGTTHQWITPPGGDLQTGGLGFKKGYSFMDVPDMVPPGCLSLPGAPCVNPAPNLSDGTQTFFWTNQQSGRLLFYHDHAYGMTRLNVYGGEAAGYLLVDPAQETALQAATSPGTIITDPSTGGILGADLAHLVPLVIQDKTFVPDSATNPGGQLAVQDPTWDVANWGGAGQLWYPHVYMPNQNPADITGSSGFGRWDWGPWFWPPQNPLSLILQPYSVGCPDTTGTAWAFPPLMCPGVPDPTRLAPSNSPSGVPEGFMDTMVVNGTAYPSLTVDPTAYRFHILNAANDRALNLGLYVAEPLSVSVTTGGTGYAVPPALPPMVAIACSTGTPGTATASVDANGAVIGVTVTNPGTLCTAPTVTIDPPPAGLQAYAIASMNTEVKMVFAAPAALRTIPDCSAASALPMAGGGQVFTTNLTTPTGLPLGCWPKYTSVFYGPLSWPADMREGGVPDPTTAGPPIIQIGTEGGLLPKPVVIPSTPVSYDYNKRSITVLNVLNHGLYVGTAERADVIVDFKDFAGKTLILYNDAPAPVPASDPRVDYYTNGPDNSATGGAPTTMAGYGPNTRTVMQIVVRTTAVNPLPTIPFSLSTLTNGNPAAVPPILGLPAIFAATQDQVIVPEPDYPALNGNGVAAYSRIFDTSLSVNSATLCAPAPAPCAKPMLPKTIQELFTLDYGRMNATLGVELPFTNFLTQTTIPYGYSDPPTEMFKDGETQIWKITHNGVDTHFIHFHLFTVQVINRVGWDGAVKPPDPTELSFKDTVRMNPLEDVIVALRPFKQDFSRVSWGNQIPNSYRPMDVIHPVGYTDPLNRTFTDIDPANNPAPVVNERINFGWEYVWHCHILGHEENDMMRAMILAVAPAVPVLSDSVVGHNVNLQWTEATNNYTGFTIQRSNNPAFPVAGTTNITVGPVLSYTNTFPAGPVPAGPYFYRMLANNLVGYTRTYPAPAVGYPHVSADSAYSNTLTINLNPLVGPQSLAFSSPMNVTSAAQVITVTNTGSTTITGLSITLGGANAGQFARTDTCGTTLGATLSCTVSVTFRPTAASPLTKSALLNVNVGAAWTDQSVALTGTIIVPIFTALPASINFGTQLVAAGASPPQTVILSNTSAAPVTGINITFTGANAGQFSRPAGPSGGTCGATLAAGANCTVLVRFNPSSIGNKTATLNTNPAAPAANRTVSLSGTGQ